MTKGSHDSAWLPATRFSLIMISLLCLLLTMSELLIASAFAFPGLFGVLPIKTIISPAYSEYRNIIQLEPLCARYDPGVTYTLRPGRFVFKNPEFKTEYMVNSMGVRDTEESLDRPGVIVVGDSLAMGWGVDQNQTYADILERESGLKVLNAAISSFGTVREMFMLNRLDTSHMKYLVIHYNPNDQNENFQFFRNGNHLRISSEKEYQHWVDVYLNNKKYFPGKYSFSFLNWFKVKIGELYGRLAWRPRIESDEKTASAGSAVEFLNAIMHASKVDLEDVQIIVIADSAFARKVNRTTADGQYPGYIKKIKTIDADNKMNSKCYFLIDDHMTPDGHRVIADELRKIIL